MSARGDRERYLAALEREHAAVLRERAGDTLSADREELLERALLNDDVAARHQALADVYDCEDDGLKV